MIHQLHKAGTIKDLKNYTSGLVTAKGTTYLLKIEDVVKFESFANNYMKEDLLFQLFEKYYVDTYKILPENTNQENEKRFLKMLDDMSSGIKLFKGSTSDFSKWGSIEMFNEDSVLESKCL